MVFNLTVQGHSLITPINVEFHPLVLVSELTLGYNTGVAFTFVTLPSPWIGATTLTDCNVFIRGVDKLPIDSGEVFFVIALVFSVWSEFMRCKLPHLNEHVVTN